MNKTNNDSKNFCIYRPKTWINQSSENSSLSKFNIPYKKIRIKICSSLVALTTILSPGIKNVANAQDRNFTRISEVQYLQKTQVIDPENPNIFNSTPKSFLVRKSRKAQLQELEVKKNEIIQKQKIKAELFHKIIFELEKIEKKEKEIQNGKTLIKSVWLIRNEEKLKKLEIIQNRNIENIRRYTNFLLEPNKNFFEKKFLKGPTLPRINQTKQIEKQLKKERVKEETILRNLIKLKNRQVKTDIFNKLIFLILPTLEKLYPIFYVNHNGKKKTKHSNLVKKQKITRENYVGIQQFLQLLEKRRNIEKLVENYETIMLFSIFMSVYQLKFNSAGRLVKLNQPFQSVETIIEEWITQNKILVCLILFSTVTILTMKILTHIENNKQEYFLYLLKVLEILRKQEQFKDVIKDILFYIVLTFMFNFMISILGFYPVGFNFEFNFDQNDINFNINLEKKE